MFGWIDLLMLSDIWTMPLPFPQRGLGQSRLSSAFERGIRLDAQTLGLFATDEAKADFTCGQCGHYKDGLFNLKETCTHRRV